MFTLRNYNPMGKAPNALGDSSDLLVAEGVNTLMDIMDSTIGLIIEYSHWVPLIVLGLMTTFIFVRQRASQKTNLHSAERAVSIALGKLQRTLAENERLKQELDRFSEQAGASTIDDERRVLQGDGGVEITLIESAIRSGDSSDSMSVEVEIVPSIEQSETHVKPTSCPRDYSPCLMFDDIVEPIKQELVRPDPVTLVGKFRSEPTLENALELIKQGVGDKMQVDTVLPTLSFVLWEKNVRDSEHRARVALDTNDRDLLDSSSKDVFIHSLSAKVKARLEVIRLDESIKLACEKRDQSALVSLLDEVRRFDDIGTNEEVPTETIDQGEAALCALTSTLEDLMSANSAARDPAKLFDAVSTEIWIWQPLKEGDSGVSMIAEALQTCGRIKTEQQIERLVMDNSEDVDSLVKATTGGRLRYEAGDVENHQTSWIKLELAQILANLKQSSCALEKGLESGSDLGGALTRAGSVLEFEPFEVPVRASTKDSMSEYDHQVVTKLNTLIADEAAKVKSLVVKAKQRVCVEMTTSRITLALDLNDPAQIRAAIDECRRAQRDGWISFVEVPQIGVAESTYRRLMGERVLFEIPSLVQNTVDIKSFLFMTSARLAFAELLGIVPPDPMVISKQAEHVQALQFYLQSRLGLACGFMATLGLERVDDLAVVTESDLRQAQVSRLLSRRVLPVLVSLGVEARSNIEATLPQLDSEYQTGVFSQLMDSTTC